jgi:hypothetical protein
VNGNNCCHTTRVWLDSTPNIIHMDLDIRHNYQFVILSSHGNCLKKVLSTRHSGFSKNNVRIRSSLCVVVAEFSTLLSIKLKINLQSSYLYTLKVVGAVQTQNNSPHLLMGNYPSKHLILS